MLLHEAFATKNTKLEGDNSVIPSTRPLPPFQQQIFRGPSKWANAHRLAPTKPNSQREWTSVHDQYRSIEVLGQGTYGIVFKAEHRETGQLAALKRCRLDASKHYGIPETTLREVCLLRDLRHENVMQLLSISCNADRLYMICEYLESDLKKYIRAHVHTKIPLLKIKDITFKILRGLAYCHGNRVIHRDLKPHNILIDGEANQIKLADFGLARFLLTPNKTLTHEVVTLWYRAPELLLGDCKYSTGIDIWSVGCIVAELLQGIPLFMGDSEIDTFFKICCLFGTPKRSEWPKQAVVQWDVFPNLKGKEAPLQSIAPHLDAAGVHFLSCIFQYDPSKRLSARDLLRHPWLSDVRPHHKLLPSGELSMSRSHLRDVSPRNLPFMTAPLPPLYLSKPMYHSVFCEHLPDAHPRLSLVPVSQSLAVHPQAAQCLSVEEKENRRPVVAMSSSAETAHSAGLTFSDCPVSKPQNPFECPLNTRRRLSDLQSSVPGQLMENSNIQNPPLRDSNFKRQPDTKMLCGLPAFSLTQKDYLINFSHMYDQSLNELPPPLSARLDLRLAAGPTRGLGGSSSSSGIPPSFLHPLHIRPQLDPFIAFAGVQASCASDSAPSDDPDALISRRYPHGNGLDSHCHQDSKSTSQSTEAQTQRVSQRQVFQFNDDCRIYSLRLSRGGSKAVDRDLPVSNQLTNRASLLSSSKTDSTREPCREDPLGIGFLNRQGVEVPYKGTSLPGSFGLTDRMNWKVDRDHESNLQRETHGDSLQATRHTRIVSFQSEATQMSEGLPDVDIIDPTKNSDTQANQSDALRPNSLRTSGVPATQYRQQGNTLLAPVSCPSDYFNRLNVNVVQPPVSKHPHEVALSRKAAPECSVASLALLQSTESAGAPNPTSETSRLSTTLCLQSTTNTQPSTDKNHEGSVAPLKSNDPPHVQQTVICKPQIYAPRNPTNESIYPPASKVNLAKVQLNASVCLPECSKPQVSSVEKVRPIHHEIRISSPQRHDNVVCCTSSPPAACRRHSVDLNPVSNTSSFGERLTWFKKIKQKSIVWLTAHGHSLRHSGSHRTVHLPLQHETSPGPLQASEFESETRDPHDTTLSVYTSHGNSFLSSLPDVESNLPVPHINRSRSQYTTCFEKCRHGNDSSPRDLHQQSEPPALESKVRGFHDAKTSMRRASADSQSDQGPNASRNPSQDMAGELVWDHRKSCRALDVDPPLNASLQHQTQIGRCLSHATTTTRSSRHSTEIRHCKLTKQMLIQEASDSSDDPQNSLETSNPRVSDSYPSHDYLSCFESRDDQASPLYDSEQPLAAVPPSQQSFKRHPPFGTYSLMIPPSSHAKKKKIDPLLRCHPPPSLSFESLLSSLLSIPGMTKSTSAESTRVFFD